MLSCLNENKLQILLFCTLLGLSSIPLDMSNKYSKYEQFIRIYTNGSVCGYMDLEIEFGFAYGNKDLNSKFV